MTSAVSGTMTEPSSSENANVRPRNANFANPYPASTHRIVAPTPPVSA